MWVDFHWHARDLKQKHKDTVKRALELAYAAGGLAIGAMPNTDPPLTTLELCRDYLQLAKDANVRGVEFYAHIGLTPDTEQVKRAIEAYRKEKGICGMKIYLGRSTGDLSVVEYEDQMKVMETLANEGYDGVLAAHCEKEKYMDDGAYDPEKPRTWNKKCRPEIAEIKSFKDLLGGAYDFGFKGIIHVAHISSLIVAKHIAKFNQDKNTYLRDKNTYLEDKRFGLGLSCGLTPHHAFLNDDHLAGEEGAWYKCNPPLRSRKTQQGLRDCLLDGRITIIESDHAPHTDEDKKFKNQKAGEKRDGEGIKLPASGIVSGIIWPYLKGILMKKGMSLDMVQAAMFGNAVRLYGFEDEIEPIEREIDFDSLEKIASHYPHDPFYKLFGHGIFTNKTICKG